MESKHPESSNSKRQLRAIFAESLISNASVFDKLEDITFIVGNTDSGIEHIRGNRTIFAVHSEVLQAQLFGNMQESKKDEIIIEDVTPDVFKFLKNLFYVKKQELNVDIVLDVLYASKKYLLTDLECECYKFIEKIDKLEDWWKIICKQTITTDINMEDALIRKSQILINNSQLVAKNDKNVADLTPEWVVKLVSSSSFVVTKEEIVWEMCLNYCKNKITSIMNDMISNGDIAINSDDDHEGKNQDHAECACVKTMMGKYFINHIRFPIMNQKYFFRKIAPTDILDIKTKYEICKSWLIDKDFKLNKEKDENYSMFTHAYTSPFCWYPRKPYDRYFLAEYDIMSLKVGDKVAAHLKNASYGQRTISIIDRTSKIVFGKGIQYHTSKDVSDWCYSNTSVQTLSQQKLLATVDLCPDAAGGDNVLTPKPQNVAEIYQEGNEVQYYDLKNDKWTVQVIETIDPNRNPWIKLKNGMFVHAWNFDQLRQVQTS